MIYTGIFFTKELFNFVDSKLEKEIAFPHITFKFKPNKEEQELFTKLIVEKVKVHIYNFKQNSDNAGFFVDYIITENKELQECFDNILAPHITTSVSEKGKPVNTSKLLNQKDCSVDNDKDFFIEGVFGYFNKGQVYFN